MKFDGKTFGAVGEGTEASPFFSSDKTAGVNAALDTLCERGGRLTLPCFRYDIEDSIVIKTPCTYLEGEVWCYPSDPNGVFESCYGTKIKSTSGKPCIEIGEKQDLGGVTVTNLGFQGEITGMDTRGFFDPGKPYERCGLRFSRVRSDQCDFTKLSFCGMGVGICADGNSELDANTFDYCNVDGCAVGVYFSPRASYYTHFRNGIFADNPYYAFYADGSGKSIHNLELQRNHFVRNGGAFVDENGAAVELNNINESLVEGSLFDFPGHYWHYDKAAKSNDERQKHSRKTVALRVSGNGNRILNNTFKNCTAESIVLQGDGNIIHGCITDGDVVVSGQGNTVSSLLFTSPSARLILTGMAAVTTTVIGVDESRIERKI